MGVRERTRHYIVSGIVKTQGIRKLKKEFKLKEEQLMNIWLEEKETLINSKNGFKKKTAKPYREQILQKAIKKNGIELQVAVAIEECGELIQALCKWIRGEEHNVEEEVADVKIVLEELEMIFNKDKIRNFRNQKIERLEKRLEDN